MAKKSEMAKEDRSTQALIAIVGILGVLFASLLIWLISEVSRVSGTQMAMRSDFNAMSSRMGEIVKVLPDIRVKVAKEEIEKPIEVAVVATQPVMVAGLGWGTRILVMDSVRYELHDYVVQLDGPDDSKVELLLKGSAFASGPNAISLQELQRFSSDIGKPISVPAYIDAGASFAFREGRPEYTKAFKTLKVTPKTSALAQKITSFESLVAELREKAALYKLQ